ncbi:hypothetical protein CPC08DRAFT_737099 [Agrocybe pediades]|nr:hypothetical protein CPC08DRAFT_737099 [Agrocybe pediades]
MNRHHPYGSPGRRGNSPDRGHRYSDRGGTPGRGRGGFQRGRGGYGNFDQNMNGHNAYDQVAHQGDYGGYNSYEHPSAGGAQPYYQNSNYADSTPANFLPPNAQNAGYNQAYPKFEDGPGAFDDEDRNRRPIRKERDDKVHDSIIEERIQRERPCRTLFIRNIKYETPSEDVRRIFEEHGEIKTFFDLIATRGMVFVTYFDLRAAERARDRLQGSEISGRPIDVHYSLPRDDPKGNDREKNQLFQGTIQVTLRNSASGLPIDDNEVRRKFQQFGDIKAIKPVGDRIDSRYVEFYDMRACTDAHDRLRHQPLQDGIMDIVFSWDDDGKEWEDRGNMRGGGNRGRGRGRGGRHRDDDDGDHRRNDYGRPGDRDYRNRGRYDDDRGGRQGQGQGQGGYGNDRYWNNNNRGYGGPPPPPPPPPNGGAGGYGGPPPPANYGGGYGAPPPAPAAAPPDDRLEQARKVQQLLAALKQPAPAPTPPPAAPAVPPMGSIPPPAANSYYPPPPAAYQQPPANAYGVPGVPPPSSPPAAAPLSNPNLANLPPNILALLQSAQQQQQRAPGPPGSQGYGMPPPPPHMMGLPPQGGAMGAPPPPANNAQYQQLMAYLQSQAAGAGKQ